MQFRIGTFYAAMMCAGLAFGQVAAAEEETDYNATTLTGDWGGKRAEWAAKGVTLDFSHKSDLIAIVDGGMARDTSWLGYTDVQLGLDLDKLMGWGGTTAFMQYHSDLGGKPNGNEAGSFMGVDNIEVGYNTAQFSQLWLEKTLMDDRLAVLFGLYAMDSEFYVTDTSGLFLHPSMGMSAEIAQTGVNGPPVYPTASLGTRIKYTNEQGYLQLAVLDGVPGDPNYPYGTQVGLDEGDGTIAIAELAWQSADAEGVSKAAIGYWRYSAKFDDLTDLDGSGNPVKRRNNGWYVLAERTLSSEAGNAAQGLAGFARFGTASADINQSNWSASAGLTYTGLFDGRDDDVAGIAFTTSHAGSKYRSANASDSHEMMIEATYKFQLQPWISVQPAVQRILNPGMDPTLDDAWVIGTRIEIVL